MSDFTAMERAMLDRATVPAMRSGLARDIDLAFVGSTKSVAYSGRKALLDELAQVENLVVTRTKSGGRKRRRCIRWRSPSPRGAA